MSREHIILMILLVICSLLFIYRLQEERGLEEKGIELANIQDQIETLKIQNSLLENQIDNAAALTTIAEKARQKGYVQLQYIYITK